MSDEEIKEWNKQILKELEEIDYEDYEVDYIGNLIINERYKVIILKGDKSEENFNISNNNSNDT
jgi:chaperonin cofactor prefoldin